MKTLLGLLGAEAAVLLFAVTYGRDEDRGSVTALIITLVLLALSFLMMMWVCKAKK